MERPRYIWIVSSSTALKAAPWHQQEIAELLSICARYGIKSWCIGVLENYTATSIQTSATSFTFDYVRACRYPARYAGGETIHNLRLLLDLLLHMPEPPCSDLEAVF
jgi:hypothetical protein